MNDKGSTIAREKGNQHDQDFHEFVRRINDSVRAFVERGYPVFRTNRWE